MALVVIQDGVVTMLPLLLGGARLYSSLDFHLFKTSIVPARDQVSTDYFPNEANFTGYSVITVPFANWSSPAYVTPQATSNAPVIVWTVGPSPSVGNQIYGYYVTPAGQTYPVLWAERFTGAPVDMTVAAEAIALYPQLTLQSLYG